MNKQSKRLDEHRIEEEPFYLPTGEEITIAETAHRRGLPLLLKGPTGCGKTRFMQYLAWRLKLPLVTVSCHDDLSTSDLVGRYLIRSGEAVWMDGPLTLAVRAGAICYLDEIVEARKDTTVVIHPLADGRRRRRLQPFAFKGLLLALDVQPLFVGHVAGGLRHLAALHLPLHPPLHVEPLLVGHLGPGGRERGPGKDNEQGRKQGRGQGTSAVGRDHGRLTGIKGLGPVVRARGAAPGANFSIEHPPRSSAQGEKMPARGSHAVAPQARPDAAETAALQRISLASEPEQDRLGAM